MQYKSLGDTNYEVLPGNFGVVQGSTLGPLVLLVYINDLVRSSLILKFNLYADDRRVCLSADNLNILIDTLNGELSKVSIWFRANRLPLSSNKSKFTFFHRRQRLIPVNVHNIVKGDEVIARVETIKFLGVYFDSHVK